MSTDAPPDTPRVPHVSIGMPVYNGAAFIRQALDALLAQTFTDFELIISDNASTDETQAICQEYAAQDARIRYIRQAENRGIAANFRAVLDEARGPFFMWAAADDIWDRGWIAALLPVASHHQCLAYGRITMIDESGGAVPHPVNDRSFDYTGPRWRRRLRYFLDPALRGKANPLYGLMPRSLLTPDILAAIQTMDDGADVRFLYHLLSKTEIRPVASVYLHKRTHAGCAGGEVQSSKHISPMTIEKLRGVGGRFLSFQVNKYRGSAQFSSLPERILLALVLPIALARDVLARIDLWIIRRRG